MMKLLVLLVVLQVARGARINYPTAGAGFPKNCPQCAGSQDAADHVCADGLTYENACYARCYGMHTFKLGPCLPSLRKLMQDDAALLAATTAGAAADSNPPEPVDTAQASLETTAAAAVEFNPAAVAGTAQASLETLDVVTPDVAPTPIATARPVSMSGARVSRAPSLVSPALTCTQAKLQVSRPNCNVGGAIYFATVYLQPSTTTCSTGTWRYRGWWSLTAGSTVWFASSNNRYFYLYAYALNCYNGACCPSQLRWSGSSYFALEGASSTTTYPFFMRDFGATVPSSYTVPLACSCSTKFCLVPPCCQC